MIEIGTKEGSFRIDEFGETVLGVINAVKRNKIRVVACPDKLDLDVANRYQILDSIYFPRWRVIGIGMLWVEATTANEDPIINFGYSGNTDAFGVMTSVITGGEKFNLGDHQKYDPRDISGKEIIAEASATMDITWTEGAEFDVWMDAPKDMLVIEAAGGLTTGKVKPYMVIEIEANGKW